MRRDFTLVSKLRANLADISDIMEDQELKANEERKEIQEKDGLATVDDLFDFMERYHSKEEYAKHCLEREYDQHEIWRERLMLKLSRDERAKRFNLK